jgi:hypothetical protein
MTKFFFKKSLGFSCWRYLYVHHLGHRNKAPNSPVSFATTENMEDKIKELDETM